jgi:hypothetical protein
VIDPNSSAGGLFIRQADGSLDPGRYSGFYELEGSSGKSFVQWNNLKQELGVTENKGADLNE